MVNEDHKPFTGPFNRPITQKKGFIAHYYTRAYNTWIKKCNKKRADTGGVIDVNMFNIDTVLNDVEDLRIKEFWEKIK